MKNVTLLSGSPTSLIDYKLTKYKMNLLQIILPANYLQNICFAKYEDTKDSISFHFNPLVVKGKISFY